MSAVDKLRHALAEYHVDSNFLSQIMEGFEKVSDQSSKERKAAFFVQAIKCMDALLDEQTCHNIRDACACSKGGWRLKAVQKLGKEYEGSTLETKIEALGHITHMGYPVLNDDGSITARIGDDEGLVCPCPVFSGMDVQEPISLTYCYCCAGHFRFHYQIALGKTLATRSVLSSALNSLGTQPCRFVYEIVD